MKTTIYKRIIGVIICAFAFMVFMPSTVSAKTCEEFKDDSSKNAYWPDRYGVQLKYKKGKFKIVLDKDTLKTNFGGSAKDIKLCITEIYSFKMVDGHIKIQNTKTPPEGKECFDVLTINDTGESFEPIDGNKGFGVKIAQGNGYRDPKFDEHKCPAEKATFEIDIRVNIGDIMAKVTDDVSEIKKMLTTTVPKEKIDCKQFKNKYSEGSFNYKFCQAWKAAETNDPDPSGEHSYKCEITSNNIDEIEKQYRISAVDSKYYIYKKYLRASQIEPNNTTYVYNYACNKVEETVSCDVECRESVVVEYGAPVVAKGSICYEYKVKVTSRVDCGVKNPPKPPEEPHPACTPIPVCYSGGMTYNQGGPDDNFDSCVKKCDGGKYSDKCSNKCYKQVYGKSLVGTVSGKEISYVNMLNTKDSKAEVHNTTDYGGYYTCSGGSIDWVAAPTATSRWHQTHCWTCNLPAGYSPGDYTRIINGIPRAYDCTDSCYWADGNCDDYDYMNPGDGEADYKENVLKYNTLIAKCNAYAHCKTETAYFTIDTSVEGGKDGNNDQDILFPYSTQKDQLVFQGDGTSKNVDTTIIGRDGCYKADNDLDKIWYQGEWTFPGTWKALKGMGIRYTPPSTPSITWQKLDKQFCFERSNNVNKKFWLYITGKDSSNTESFGNTQYFKQCVKSKFSGTGSVAAPQDVDKLRNLSPAYVTGVPSGSWKYNIHANTTDFGHFKWNIDINCFYAYYNCVPSPTDDDGGNPTTDYRVRTVDLKNLFPSDSGDKITDASKTGRAPGYNWSNFAKNDPGNDTSKVGTYRSNPFAYVKEVQQKGYTVYSDEYLDYRIVLTKENIRAIRNDNNNKEYGSFDTEMYNMGDSIYYKSRLLRDSSKISKATLPDNNALKCNNIDTDHKSCKNFS